MKWLCLGLCLLLSACQKQVTQARWTAPPGPWAGLELVGVGWESSGPNDPYPETHLELRCQANPRQRLRRVYWPGPEWRGTVTWGEAAVTYEPPRNWSVGGRPLAALSIGVTDMPWRSACAPLEKP